MIAGGRPAPPLSSLPRLVGGKAQLADPQRTLPVARLSGRPWLLALALLCAAQLVSHSGSRNGFLESSRPLYSADDTLPANGYVSWVGAVPVLHDADGVLTITAFLLGGRVPENTGILDRRAAYAYLASLTIPWVGAYGGFLLLNLLFWWSAAASAYWIVRRRWRDEPLALATSFLVAAGNGFLFMAGVPMSYLAAYASAMLLLALGEWLQGFSHPRLGAWMVLGWGGGVAATIYFTHFVLLAFWWLYGLRRVPLAYLLVATSLTLGIAALWEAYGTALAGLAFTTDNSGLIGDSLSRWLSHLRAPFPELLTYFRGGPIAGAAATRATLAGAFPPLWWALAAIGLLASDREDREWVLAVALAALLPTLILLSLLPLPRLAYYMFPAMSLMAARGALLLGRIAHAVAAPFLAPRLTPLAAPATVLLALGALALLSNLDLLGFQHLNVQFHFSAPTGQ